MASLTSPAASSPSLAAFFREEAGIAVVALALWLGLGSGDTEKAYPFKELYI